MNAKEEFLDLVSYKPAKCAMINAYGYHTGEDIKLKVGYTHDDYLEFLEELDFDYDHGYGIQELHGTVWFDDGTWAERHEYDGSEWWVCQSLPEIPNELL